MSVYVHFGIWIVDAVLGIRNRLHAIQFGVYGATEVGKTTLHNQLRTRGNVGEIKKRTVGRHRATRKVVKIDGDVRTLKTADCAGEVQYWHEWAEDIRKRKVRYIIFMIDNRHLKNPANMQNQLAWQYLTDLITDDYWRKGNRRKRKKHTEFPIAVGLWANKYELWKENPSYDGPIEEHPIFAPFVYGLEKLHKKGIPTHKYIMSAKSDSEMVYRGVMTMIKDY